MADAVDPCLVDTDSVILSIADDGVSLQADANLAGGTFQGLETRPSGLYVPRRHRITDLSSGAQTLPTGAADGDQIEIRPDPNDLTVVWTAIYDAASAKWIADTHNPMVAEVPANSTKAYAAGAWGVCADGAGPDVQLPTLGGGSLKVGLQWGFRGAGNGSGEMFMSPKFSVSEATQAMAAQNNATTLASVHARARVTVADGTKIQSRYLNLDNTGAALFQRRWLYVYLVSIG